MIAVNRFIAVHRSMPANKGGFIMLFSLKEKGQGLVEYALILILASIIVVVILYLLGPAIGNLYSNIVDNI
jgi:pilus assembly protein Flp/PilA